MSTIFMTSDTMVRVNAVLPITLSISCSTMCCKILHAAPTPPQATANSRYPIILRFYLIPPILSPVGIAETILIFTADYIVANISILGSLLNT